MTYAIMTSSAKVSSRARLGRYRNVAVVEHAEGGFPAMISPRARGMIRIVRHFGACSVGKTDRCEYRRTLKEAVQLLDSLRQGMSGAKEYREGWQYCLDGGDDDDGRFMIPHVRYSEKSYAWNHGFMDCMEREEDDKVCEPECAGYGEG